jgi:hypothetical protein
MADEWLRDVSETFLDFTPAAWASMLDEHGKSRRDGNAVEDFLGPAFGKGTSLFLYVRSVREEKSTKVKRRREVPVEAAPAAEPAAAAAAPPGGDAATAGDAPAAEAPPAEGAAAAEVDATALQESKDKEAADAAPTTVDAAADEAAAAASAAAAEAAAAEAAATPKTRFIEEEVIETGAWPITDSARSRAATQAAKRAAHLCRITQLTPAPFCNPPPNFQS